MLDRRDLLDRAKSPEERTLIARVIDRIETVLKNHEAAVTEFYDPAQQNLISPVLIKVPGISFIWAGGYDLAERKRLVFCPEYLDVNGIADNIGVLTVTGNLKFQSLSHRDFLGAILGLGIKREKIGDLIVTIDGCQVIVDLAVAEYMKANLTKVHRVGVKVAMATPEELLLSPEETIEVFATVASLRLDAVAAAGYGVSRTKVAGDIAAEKAKVNWAVVTDCAFAVKEGDTISLRGRGRVEVVRIKGETKKGRISLVLKRFK